MKKGEKGITLIALVITIIVLLIISSVTIKLLLDDNGIIKRASASVELTRSAQLDEKVKMAILDAKMQGEGKILSTESLNNSLKNYLKEEEYTLQEDGTNGWIITTKYKIYKVNNDGTFEELENEEKNEITVTLSPNKDLETSRSQEVSITIQSKLPIASSKIEVMWSKDNIEENKLPEDFETLSQEISVTKEGNILTGTAFNPGVTESGNYYLYIKAVINGETIIQKGGEYTLQRAPTSSDISITPTSTTDTSVKVKIESTEVFEGYELQYHIEGTNWTKYTGEVEVTENTTIYGRLYNKDTKDSVGTSLTIDTIKCLHPNMESISDTEHKCTKCGYTEEHTMQDYSNSYHRCSVCGDERIHEWETTSSTHTCKICNKSEEHTWQQDYYDSNYAQCSVCGETHQHMWTGSDESSEHSCWCGAHEQHDWECTSDYSSHYCSKCGAGADHAFVDVGGSEHYCSVCDFREPHRWTSDSAGHYCELCGTRGEHMFMEGICSMCGYECTAHMWDMTDSMYHRCTMCGYYENHSWEDGRCTTCWMECMHSWMDGYCSICGKMCEHSWTMNDESSHMCMNCGLSEPHEDMRRHVFKMWGYIVKWRYGTDTKENVKFY